MFHSTQKNKDTSEGTALLSQSILDMAASPGAEQRMTASSLSIRELVETIDMLPMSRLDRHPLSSQKPVVAVLLGIAIGRGKSTTGNMAADLLRTFGFKVKVIESDAFMSPKHFNKSVEESAKDVKNDVIIVLKNILDERGVNAMMKLFDGNAMVMFRPLGPVTAGTDEGDMDTVIARTMQRSCDEAERKKFPRALTVGHLKQKHKNAASVSNALKKMKRFKDDQLKDKEYDTLINMMLEKIVRQFHQSVDWEYLSTLDKIHILEDFGNYTKTHEMLDFMVTKVLKKMVDLISKSGSDCSEGKECESDAAAGGHATGGHAAGGSHATGAEEKEELPITSDTVVEFPDLLLPLKEILEDKTYPLQGGPYLSYSIGDTSAKLKVVLKEHFPAQADLIDNKLEHHDTFLYPDRRNLVESECILKLFGQDVDKSKMSKKQIKGIPFQAKKQCGDISKIADEYKYLQMTEYEVMRVVGTKDMGLMCVELRHKNPEVEKAGKPGKIHHLTLWHSDAYRPVRSNEVLLFRSS